MSELNLKSFDIPVLSYLSEEHFIAIEELSSKLSLSRIDIEKQVQQLEQLGYSLATDEKRRLRIISRPDILLPIEIKNKLTSSYIGQTIYYFPALTSTNTIAKKKLIEKIEKIPEGTIIITEKQSGGKGRSGKRWYSPQGGIWFSVILYPDLIPSNILIITLMTAVAVAKTIHQLFPQISIQIKWPNDLLIEDRKVCGILTEATTNKKNAKWVILGIGINANNDLSELPEDIRKDSISLKEVAGQLIPRALLVSDLCVQLEKWYEKLKRKDFISILKEWRLYSNIIGKEVKIDTGGKIITGEVIDLTRSGALILKIDKGKIKEIISGTVLK